MQSPPTLILASTSTYRRGLLQRLGVEFTCQNPGVDEKRLPDEAVLALVSRLALAKAEAIGARFPGAWVIGSDQAAVREDAPDTVLGKPGNPARCIAQLQACSGRAVQFLTAVALIRAEDGAVHQFVDTTRVQFRELDAPTIERYVEREAPLDCAGGFKCEGLGIALFERIESRDPTALVGLPLIHLAALLREAGFAIP